MHRYILQKYNGPVSRHICPQCKDSKKSFVLYLDSETMLSVHSSVGRCNRESKCGFHYPPKQFFEDNNLPSERSAVKGRIVQKPASVSFISHDILSGSLKMYETNNFVHFLASRFGKEVVTEALGRYFIGTSKHWPGATVFWQVDKLFRIRTGKIMLYNPITGRRVKEPFDCISWVHSALKLSGYTLKQCLFGEHLLTDSSGPVAIVESEKTAVVASIFFPDLIWLATGGLSNLSAEKIKVLSGRKVILFPDVKGFHKWDERMKEISRFMTDTRFSISDLLEKNATEEEKQRGCDIADYLISTTSRLHKPKSTINEKSENNDPQKTTFNSGVEQGKNAQSSTLLPEWHIRLESIFDKIRIEHQTIHLFPSMNDQSYFLDSIDF
jgi:hypothetical protein